MDDHAEFVPGKAPERTAWLGNRAARDDSAHGLEHLHQVLHRRRGSDFFSRWIEVRYGEFDYLSTVYLYDGGWNGWQPLLTRTNRAGGRR